MSGFLYWDFLCLRFGLSALPLLQGVLDYLLKHLYHGCFKISVKQFQHLCPLAIVFFIPLEILPMLGLTSELLLKPGLFWITLWDWTWFRPLWAAEQARCQGILPIFLLTLLRKEDGGAPSPPLVFIIAKWRQTLKLGFPAPPPSTSRWGGLLRIPTPQGLCWHPVWWAGGAPCCRVRGPSRTPAQCAGALLLPGWGGLCWCEWGWGFLFSWDRLELDRADFWTIFVVLCSQGHFQLACFSCSKSRVQETKKKKIPRTLATTLFHGSPSQPVSPLHSSRCLMLVLYKMSMVSSYTYWKEQGKVIHLARSASPFWFFNVAFITCHFHFSFSFPNSISFEFWIFSSIYFYYPQREVLFFPSLCL